jgi:hypothetical protein
MKYLKLTIERNRKKIQLEELLLLLMRIAALVLLFYFLARPVLNPTGLEQWLGSGGRSSQVILIDDSLSMGYALAEPAAFERAKETASALLSTVRPQDRITVVTTSMPRSPVLHEVEGSRHDDLSATVLSLPQTATHAAWPAVFEALDEVLRSCTYPSRQLTIITDMRKSGWQSSVGSITRRWHDEKVRTRIVDVGADETTNLALEALVPLDRTILAGAESKWEAVIRNDTPRIITGAKAILRVDEKPTEIRLPEIPPQQVARVPVSVQFTGTGAHDLSFQLPDDELNGDNQRWLSVPVKDSLLIRLVDGEPSTVPFGSEVDYLAAPLSIGIGAAEAWKVEVVDEQDFVAQKLDPADVLVLANVAAPTPDQANRLKTLVRDGMGLMIFSGAKVDTGMYNDLLFRENDRILPCKLKGMIDEKIQGVYVETLRPSPLEKLLDLKTTALERVTARQIMAVDEPDDPERVRVLARWNNPARSPAVIERIAGEGRVLLWTTTADRAATDWPIEPSFVLAVREAVKGTARPTAFTKTITAGDVMIRGIETSQQVANAQLTAPGGGEPRALSAVPRPAADGAERGSFVDLTVTDTRRAGLYRLTWDEGALGAQQDLYAANPDPRESALERISASELKAMLEPLVVEVASAKKGGSDLFSATGREIWHSLAWGLLGLLVIESIFATWVGRAR